MNDEIIIYLDLCAREVPNFQYRMRRMALPTHSVFLMSKRQVRHVMTAPKIMGECLFMNSAMFQRTCRTKPLK